MEHEPLNPVALLVAGAILLLTWWGGGPPPRYRELRGRKWGDANGAQKDHLDHYFPPTEGER